MLFSASAYAQFSSSIEGTVTDSSGAVVPGASVVLTGSTTGVVIPTKANATGYFKFPSLGPGSYKITVDVPGFATETVANITLTAEQTRTVPLALKPKSDTTNVIVDAAQVTVDTDEAKVGSVITQQQVEELPLQGGNIYNVTNQAPGVTGTGLMGSPSSNTDIFFATTTPAIVANGAPNHSNTYLLDGISLDDSPSGGDAKLVPNRESVQEVVVTTNDYSSQFGKAASLVTQITTKSGSDTFHGSAGWEYQSSKLTARTMYQNYKDPLNGYITPYHRDEFRGSLGGPVRKDHTFFFASYDQVVSSTSSAGPAQFEDPAFSSWLKTNLPNNLSTQLIQQYPVTANPTPNSIQTVAEVQTIQNYFPSPATNCSDTTTDPSQIGPLGIPCSLNMFDISNATTVAIHNGYQYNGRVDQTFANSRDRVYANMYKTHLLGPWDTSARQGFDINFPQDAWFAAVNYTHVFSPSVVNEDAFGYTRTSVDIPCKNCALLPTGVNGILGFGDGFAPVGFAQNDFHWRDMVSIVHGKHALKTGFEWFHNEDYAPFTVPDNRQQGWGFDNIFDFAADKADELGTISFNPTTGGAANNNRYYRDSTYGAYIQDDWKARKDLSINIGLRWDALSNPSEGHGTLSTLNVPTTGTLLEQIEGISVGLQPETGKRRPFIDLKKTYFAPRLGFAWQPFGLRNWSVRGGYGIFFDRGGNHNWSDTETGNPPIDANFTASVHTPGSPQPPAFALCQSAVFPYNCPLPTGLTTTLPALNPRGGYGLYNGIGGPDPHLKMAYAENMFFGVQRSLKSNWIFEGDFIHALSIHEYFDTNMNRITGYNSITWNGVPGGFNQTLIQANLPNPYFAGIDYSTNRAGSGYNGFASSVRKNFSKGYSFQVAYTVQKTIDTVSTVPGVDKGAETSIVVDAYNIRAQRGVSSQNVPQQLSMNGFWKIPTPFLQNGFLKNAVGGWEISALSTFLEGFPASVFTTKQEDDFNLDGQQYDYPNRPVAGTKFKGFSKKTFMNGTFQASQFPLPVDQHGIPLGIEGNGGRNTFRGPGFDQTDGALAKNTSLPWFGGEKKNLQIRMDFYNIFNVKNLQGWDTNLADDDVAGGVEVGNFGKTTGVGQARTLQFSGVFRF
jgi:hypothetical protein